MTRDYIDDLAKIKRDLDAAAEDRRTKVRRHAESAGEALRHSPDRLAARLATLERRADELLKQRH